MKGIAAALLLCLVLVSSIACNPFGGDNDTAPTLVKVARGDVMITISGSGNIDVSNEVSLAFSRTGKIDEIYVDEGDTVNKGDALAKLDTSALELALTQAQVARDEAEYNLNQLRTVLHASYDRVKLAEGQLEAAEQAVAEAEKQLDESTIIAPFDGAVASVDVDEGDNVTTVTIIVHLIDPSNMEVTAEVDEIDIAEVEPGQKAIIDIDALPALQLEGKVISISLLPEEEAGVIVYEVTIGFDVAEGSGIKPGMSADVDIVINERNNVLLVPSRAIKKDSQGNPMVKVMVNEEIKERPVVTGISNDFQTEIVEGLKEGETVVVEKRG